MCISYPCYRSQYDDAMIIILGNLCHMCTQAVLFKRALAYMNLPGVRSPSLSHHNSTLVLHLCQNACSAQALCAVFLDPPK